MTTNVHNLLNQALLLPADDRAALAASLLESLDTQIAPNLDAEWDVEIKRRITEIDNGDVVLVPWDTVMDKMRRLTNG